MLPVDGMALYECLAGVGIGFMFGFVFGCDWARGADGGQATRLAATSAQETIQAAYPGAKPKRRLDGFWVIGYWTQNPARLQFLGEPALTIQGAWENAAKAHAASQET